jgi:hypothetical protein
MGDLVLALPPVAIHTAPRRAVFPTRIEDESRTPSSCGTTTGDDCRNVEQPGLSRTFQRSTARRTRCSDVELWVPGFNPRTVVSYDYDAFGRMNHKQPAGAAIQYA